MIGFASKIVVAWLLGSVAAATGWQTGVASFSPLTLFMILATAFMVFTHRGNIARMRVGTEPRRYRA